MIDSSAFYSDEHIYYSVFSGSNETIGMISFYTLYSVRACVCVSVLYWKRPSNILILDSFSYEHIPMMIQTTWTHLILQWQTIPLKDYLWTDHMDVNDNDIWCYGVDAWHPNLV